MFYLNTFLFFSILGYTYETIFHFLEHKMRENILFGPWMPIYGFGILCIELIHKILTKLKINGKKKLLYCFILSVIFLTIIEEIGGLIILYFFQTSFWNYESIPLSIGPYINILVSLIWGVLGLFLEYIIYPLVTPWLKKIPKWVSILLFLLLLLDNIWSFFNKCTAFMWFIP
ncbi:MAG: putative ABC transporter permease [Bacilli bacterium]|nr:putative ABC transporter permease [Bacilli bacterium]